MEKLTLPREFLTFVGLRNTTIMVTKVIILGFRDINILGSLLLLVFGVVYLATIFGNLLLMVLVSTHQGF